MIMNDDGWIEQSTTATPGTATGHWSSTLQRRISRLQAQPEVQQALGARALGTGRIPHQPVQLSHATKPLWPVEDRFLVAESVETCLAVVAPCPRRANATKGEVVIQKLDQAIISNA